VEVGRRADALTVLNLIAEGPFYKLTLFILEQYPQADNRVFSTLPSLENNPSPQVGPIEEVTTQKISGRFGLDWRAVRK